MDGKFQPAIVDAAAKAAKISSKAQPHSQQTDDCETLMTLKDLISWNLKNSGSGKTGTGR